MLSRSACPPTPFASTPSLPPRPSFASTLNLPPQHHFHLSVSPPHHTQRLHGHSSTRDAFWPIQHTYHCCEREDDRFVRSKRETSHWSSLSFALDAQPPPTLTPQADCGKSEKCKGESSHVAHRYQGVFKSSFTYWFPRNALILSALLHPREESSTTGHHKGFEEDLSYHCVPKNRNIITY